MLRRRLSRLLRKSVRRAGVVVGKAVVLSGWASRRGLSGAVLVEGSSFGEGDSW